MWCVSALEILLCLKSNKTFTNFDATELSNVYIYLVFVGNGCLALVPSHSPHLRELSLKFCNNVCDKYIKELLAALPGLVVMKSWDVIVGAMRNKHLETTQKCCTSNVDGIITKWALPDQSEYSKCNH
jgi:hypothetical protein